KRGTIPATNRDAGDPGRARQLQRVRDLRRGARRAAFRAWPRRDRLLSRAAHLLSRIRVSRDAVGEAAHHTIEAPRYDHAYPPVFRARAWCALRRCTLLQRGKQSADLDPAGCGEQGRVERRRARLEEEEMGNAGTAIHSSVRALGDTIPPLRRDGFATGSAVLSRVLPGAFELHRLWRGARRDSPWFAPLSVWLGVPTVRAVRWTPRARELRSPPHRGMGRRCRRHEVRRRR